MRDFYVFVKWNDGSRKVTALTNLRVLPFDGKFNKRLDVCKVSQQDRIGEIFPTAVCRINQVEIAWQMGSSSSSASQLADLADILIFPSAAILGQKVCSI